MANIPRVDSFPMPCPVCAANAGFPFKATTSRDSAQIKIEVRCHACQHEWRAYMDRVEPKQNDLRHAG
ncbi:MAG: hypothetical protein K2Y23_12455 [Cyanobacteria bacterium]|nr:hypothetical protein [Cyanobacteriota bacterium]